jgi:YD repeat-containing protein
MARTNLSPEPNRPSTRDSARSGNRRAFPEHVLTQVRGATTGYTYDRADRITAAGATSITVNANGTTIAKGSDSFAYDQANRLSSATVAGATETYAYEGDGVRFTRQVGGNPAIRYVTDPNRGLPVTSSPTKPRPSVTTWRSQA